ncbi:MAG: hypothetical protein E6K38_13450 [Gammaproteobacteria bacterium]|nr:MAG: hypothetical protein E6K38_13450 [Gammaproteobacteria bacterium]
MRISGSCHCGNITFSLDWRPEPAEIPARACSCSFCLKHGGLWTSCPTGSLRITIRQPALVSRYSFGTRTAEFQVCSSCGVVPAVTSRIDGRLYAVVSVNAFQDVNPVLLKRAAARYDGESESARVARRKLNWIADVEVQAGNG